MDVMGKEISQNITLSITSLVAENVFHSKEPIPENDRSLKKYEH